MAGAGVTVTVTVLVVVPAPFVTERVYVVVLAGFTTSVPPAVTLDESMSTASCLSIYLAKYPVFALTFTPSTFVRIPIFRNVPSFALFDG